jgi:hypothetical protein
MRIGIVTFAMTSESMDVTANTNWSTTPAGYDHIGISSIRRSLIAAFFAYGREGFLDTCQRKKTSRDWTVATSPNLPEPGTPDLARIVAPLKWISYTDLVCPHQFGTSHNQDMR